MSSFIGPSEGGTGVAFALPQPTVSSSESAFVQNPRTSGTRAAAASPAGPAAPHGHTLHAHGHHHGSRAHLLLSSASPSVAAPLYPLPGLSSASSSAALRATSLRHDSRQQQLQQQQQALHIQEQERLLQEHAAQLDRARMLLPDPETDAPVAPDPGSVNLSNLNGTGNNADGTNEAASSLMLAASGARRGPVRALLLSLPAAPPVQLSEEAERLLRLIATTKNKAAGRAHLNASAGNNNAAQQRH